jgi:hypothetical protein
MVVFLHRGSRAFAMGNLHRLQPPVIKRTVKKIACPLFYATGFLRVPIPSIVTSTVSPDCIGPMPDVVPVAITSPAYVWVL